MARRLNKKEEQARQLLWEAHDLLKGNPSATNLINSAIDAIEATDKSIDLTNKDYDALLVGAKPMKDKKRRGLIMRHGKSTGRYWLYRTVCPQAKKQVEIRIGAYSLPTDKAGPAEGSDGNTPSDAEKVLIDKYGTADLVKIKDARHIWKLLDARRKDGLPFTDDEGKPLPLAAMLKPLSHSETEYTVRWLCEKYLHEYAYATNIDGQPVKRSAYDDERLIEKYLLPDYGDMPLVDFNAAVIDELLDGLEGTPRQQQKLFSLLHVMNAVARKKPPKRAKIRITKNWVPNEIKNPMPEVTEIVTHETKRYVSSNEEIQRYAENLINTPGPNNDALLLQLQTFARVNEIAGLSWKEIDLERKIWTLPAERAKNGHEHKVYLSEQSVALLERRRAENPDTEWVFPSSKIANAPIAKQTPIHTIAANRAAFQVDDRFTSHAGRRRGLTWLRENGVNKEIRDAVSNHHVSGVDDDYSGTANMESLARVAVQRWCDFIHASESAGNVVTLKGAQ